MKLINNYKKVELHVSENLIEELGRIGKRHFPNEFGGFLIGNYSENNSILNIVDHLVPRKYKGFRFLFERSIDGLISTLKKLFQNNKQYYVGEWHTHPNGTTHYSKTDLQSMKEIEECETVNIKNPILLILSVNENELLELKFYLYSDGALTEYETN